MKQAYTIEVLNKDTSELTRTITVKAFSETDALRLFNAYTHSSEKAGEVSVANRSDDRPDRMCMSCIRSRGISTTGLVKFVATCMLCSKTRTVARINLAAELSKTKRSK